MWNISSHFLTMKELEIGKTKGTSYVKTFNFVYWGAFSFSISYSFKIKKRLEVERPKTWSPYCASQFSTLFFIHCAFSREKDSFHSGISLQNGTTVVRYSFTCKKLTKIFLSVRMFSRMPFLKMFFQDFPNSLRLYLQSY